VQAHGGQGRSLADHSAAGFLLVELNHEWGPIPRAWSHQGQSSDSELPDPQGACGEHRVSSVGGREDPQPRFAAQPAGPAPWLKPPAAGATSFAGAPAGIGGEGPRLVVAAGTGQMATHSRLRRGARSGEQRRCQPSKSPNEIIGITLKAPVPGDPPPSPVTDAPRCVGPLPWAGLASAGD